MQKCPLFWSKLDIFPVFCEILQNPPLFEKIPQFPILKNLSPLLGQKSHKTGKFPPFGHTASNGKFCLYLCQAHGAAENTANIQKKITKRLNDLRVRGKIKKNCCKINWISYHLIYKFLFQRPSGAAQIFCWLLLYLSNHSCILDTFKWSTLARQWYFQTISRNR